MKQVTGVDFQSEVLAAKQPVVVDFFTDGCSPCRALAPILAEWEGEANGAFKVVKVDAAADYELAASYRVNAVPAIFLFANGKCIGQTMGLKSKNALKQWFDEAQKAAA